MNYKTLKEYVIKRVKPEVFYPAVLELPELKLGAGWTNFFCPFHNAQWRENVGKSASFGIHDTGGFRCHSPRCEVHGKSIVNFYEQYFKVDWQKACRKIYRQFINKTIKDSLVDEWHKVLLDSPSVLAYITDQRGLSIPTIKRFKLGFDGVRITIPVYDQFGFCVDVRRYDFTKKSPRKILSYKEGYGGSRLFPIDNVLASTGRILLCEGEWDALLAIDRGYRAVTVTSGAGHWPDDPADGTKLFVGKSVRIVYDVNDVDSQGQVTDAGQIGARKVAEILGPVASSVKIVKLPLNNAGGDITDWFMKFGHTKGELDELIERTPLFSKNVKVEPAQGALEKVRLDEAADSKYYYKYVSMDCLIAGKDTSPYLPPKKVSVTTTDDEGNKEEEKFEVKLPFNRDILRLVSCSQGQLKGALAEMFDLKGESFKFETLETFNMEELRIIPAIDLRDFDGTYAIRRAIYVGHGLESNHTYRMKAYTVPDPDTQQSVHVITEAEPLHDSIEEFELTEPVHHRLTEKFKSSDVEAHLLKVAGWQSRNVTKIKKRPDLHLAIDLVFHSVLTFNFNGEEVTKGWLEALVIGDTRCGKGYVAERLSRFYRLGETVTGENCSFAGLVGGLQKNNDHWFVTWGKIPLNDKRLVIIDEASNLTHEMIGQMSRVRSEGVAEIIKIQAERTRARTRLIWLSNPRSGRPINTYNNGVEAIMELMGNTEDVSRLDFAMTVAASEVPSRVINAPPNGKDDHDDFEASDFTNLILWAWSRKPEQIVFSEQATHMILEAAVKMGKTYSPSIPLVQAENMRIKLAKLAAAVAVKCYSTDETGQRLIIKSRHVEFAYNFLNQIYSKPSMGYDAYSSNTSSQNHIPDEDVVIKLIRNLKDFAIPFVEGMLELTTFTVFNVADYTAQDHFECKALVGQLVRMKCVGKEPDREVYFKRPGFVNLLRHMRERLLQEERS